MGPRLRIGPRLILPAPRWLIRAMRREEEEDNRMTSYQYNWLYSFKNKQILEAIDRRLEEGRQLIKENEAKLRSDLPVEEIEKGLDQLEEIEGMLGLSMSEARKSMRRKMRKAHMPTLDWSNRRLVEKLYRLKKVLETQDPHRQYKLSFDDVKEFGLVNFSEEEMMGEELLAAGVELESDHEGGKAWEVENKDKGWMNRLFQKITPEPDSTDLL
jgi:hypothetical protein